MKKYFIIAFMLLTTLTHSQDKFIGEWTSNGLATDMLIEVVDNKINIECVSSNSFKPLETTNVVYKNNKITLDNYFKPNNWSSNKIIEYKNKDTLLVTIQNKMGLYEIAYIKK
tara:strand:+ start:24 stop:362 length:339 start_codon:yes stop_codon:yes gene_type:complete